MNKISISQAWSYATSFFAGQGVNHAIALIGVGICIPLVLQFALGGGAAAMTDPMSFASGNTPMAMGGLMMLLSLINYVLQTGSYFASWRIGLTNGGESIGSALAFGFVAALPVLGVGIAVAIVLAIVAFLIFGSMFAAGVSGNPSPDGFLGMGIALLLLLPLFLAFLTWLAARFCCSGPIMADQRSYNILTALGDSWRMTAASQWKIFGYFLLLFLALFVILMVLGAIVGVSMFAGGGMPGTASIFGLIVGALLLSIPMAYLQVGIPAGIYRALGTTNQSDIFA